MDLNRIIAAIQSVMPKNKPFIALHEPQFNGNEWAYIKDCLDTGWVSSSGTYVDRFEKELSGFTGASHAVAVVNGTAAIHVCLKVIGVGAGDEVLVPALTFIATANAVSYCGAIPHFVDSEMKTMGIDPEKLRDYLKSVAEIRSDGSYNKFTGRRIKAAVAMHTFGHPADMDPLIELCQAYNITLIEDAAQSLGTLYKGRHTGTFGRLSAVSFNGNKIITTGGGGAIFSNDASLAKHAKHLTTTAKIPHKWLFVHDHTGFNYRLPNVNAALGCAQLERLHLILAQKRYLAESYRDRFEHIGGITFFTEPEFACSNYWLNVLMLDEATASYRDKLLELTNNKGIMTRPAWVLMHKLPMYSSCPKMDLSVAESLERRIINIPSSSVLGEENGYA